MSNTFVSLPLPVSGPASSVDVSGLAPTKTLVIEGGNAATIVALEGSEDGTNFAPVLTINGSADDVVFCGVYSRLRLNLIAGPPPTAASVGAEATTANLFTTLNVPTTDGVGTSFDSSTYGAVQTFAVSGPYAGIIIIEGSNDGGSTYDPIAAFDTGNSDVKQSKGVYQRLRIRRTKSGPAPVVGVGASPAAAGGSAGPPGPPGPPGPSGAGTWTPLAPEAVVAGTNLIEVTGLDLNTLGGCYARLWFNIGTGMPTPTPELSMSLDAAGSLPLSGIQGTRQQSGVITPVSDASFIQLYPQEDGAGNGYQYSLLVWIEGRHSLPNLLWRGVSYTGGGFDDDSGKNAFVAGHGIINNSANILPDRVRFMLNFNFVAARLVVYPWPTSP